MTAIERRIVTVVFADLVGFTSLSERLAPEDVVAIQDAYIERAREAVTRHGGHVQKFIGDAVAATFGIPKARDTDAVRAVRAAWAIVGAIAGVRAPLGLEEDELHVRVGANTGLVVVAEHPSDPAGWRITGDAVNVAARFQAAAEPGEVLIGKETALAVGDAFHLEKVEPLRLKGKTDPVPAWLVRGPREAGSSDLEWLERTRLLGRDEELNHLTRDAAPYALRLVVAPPGVGKSRLLAAAADRLANKGTACWRASDLGAGAAGYGPIAGLLRAALPEADQTSARETLSSRLDETGIRGNTARVAVDHAAAVGWSNQLPSADPEAIHQSVITCLDAVAPGLVAWLFEDLHNASPDVFSFLERATQPASRGRLVLATGRPAVLEVGSKLAERAEVLLLEPLSPEAMVELIEELVGPGVIDPSTAEAAVDASGGNPLFIEELIRSWVLSERLVRDPDTGGWAAVEELTPETAPSTVGAIYLGQIDDLGPGPRHLVQVASVMGVSFPSSALPDLGIDIPDGLHSLLHRGLLEGPMAVETDHHGYRYRHALLRDAAYESLTRGERSRLHEAYAGWLREQPASPPVAEMIAVHLQSALIQAPSLGRDSELASRAAEALEHAADVYLAAAPQRAAELYRSAVETTSADEWEDRLRRRMSVAEAERRSGQLIAAMEAFADAGEEAYVAHHGTTLAAAAIGFENALFASRLPRVEHGGPGRVLLDRALELLSLRPSGLRANVEAARARAAVYEDGPEAALGGARESVAVAEAAGDRASASYARLTVRLCLEHPRHLLERRRVTEEMVADAASAGERELEFEGTRMLLTDHLRAGDAESAGEAAERATEQIVALGQPQYFWYPPMWRAMQSLLRGELDRAPDAIEQFRVEAQQWGYRDTLLVHAAQAIQLALEQGETQQAESVSSAAEEVAGTAWYPLAARLAVTVGDYGDATHRLRQLAEADFASLPADLSASYALALLIEVAAALEDEPILREMATRLGPWSGQTVVVGSGAVCLGAADRFLGIAYARMGQPDRALKLLGAAARTNRSMGARPALAHTLMELESLHRRRGEADLADRARAEAVDIAEACNMRLDPTAAGRRP